MRHPVETIDSHRPARLGYVAIGLAAGGWAVAAIAARRLFEAGVEPFDLSAARSIIAGIGLAPAFLGSRKTTGHLPQVYLVGFGLSIALVNAVYYLAIERLPVAVAIVLQYTAPALVVGWAALVSRRAPSRDVMAALVLAVVGVALVVELVGGEFTSLNGAGIVFGFMSAALFATYSLLAERAARVYGALGAMARAFLVASVFWIIFEIPRAWPQELFAPKNLPDVLFVGIGGTLLPFLLYVWGIRQIRAERATIAATLEPVFAATAAWIWLGQTLSVVQLVGGALVLVAVAMLQVSRVTPELPLQETRIR